jgi:phage shock protein PspC (stress-responsive transcriptional regulator)
MNKTVNINLGGTFFYIDEEAYQKLSRYFEAIKKYLSDSDGKDEIMRDIEIRIAELFSEKLKSDRQVISMEDLDEVIDIMGEPEDYRIDDDQAPERPSYTSSQRTSKKLYRDTEEGILGGVLAGLGHYFGVDKVWIRIIFALLFIFYGTGFLLYIILWIVMPEAKTTSEKLEMKGQPINISNIEKKVKEEFDNLSQKVNNIDYKNFEKKVEKGANSLGTAIEKFFTYLFKIIGKLIGLFLIMGAITALVFLIILTFTLGSNDLLGVELSSALGALTYSDFPLWGISILIFMAFGIPAIALIFFGFRILISNSKPTGKMTKYTMLGLWIIAVITLSVIGFRQATEFSYIEKAAQTEYIQMQPQDTLFIKQRSHKNYQHKQSDFSLVLDENDNEVIYSGDIRTYIHKTKEAQPYVVIEKYSKGNSLINAKKRAEQIKYNFEIQGNQLAFDDYLIAEIKDKYRNQSIKVHIYIPENKVFYIDEESKRWYSFESNSRYRNHEYLDAGHLYRLEGDSFKCLDCKEIEIEVHHTDKIETNSEIPDKNHLKISEDRIIKGK